MNLKRAKREGRLEKKEEKEKIIYIHIYNQKIKN